MSDHKPSEPSPSDFKEAAQRSQDAGIADESAAYENAIEKDGPASTDKGAPPTKHGGSGTSTTD